MTLSWNFSLFSLTPQTSFQEDVVAEEKLKQFLSISSALTELDWRLGAKHFLKTCCWGRGAGGGGPWLDILAGTLGSANPGESIFSMAASPAFSFTFFYSSTTQALSQS